MLACKGATLAGTAVWFHFNSAGIPNLTADVSLFLSVFPLL